MKDILLISKFYLSDKNAVPPAQDFSEKLSNKFYKIYKTSYYSRAIIKFIDKIFNILKLRKKYSVALIDLFSGRSIPSNYILCIILKLLRKKIILNLQGGDLPNGAKKYKIIINHLFRLSDYLVAPSPYLQKELSKYSNKAILIIPNSINLDIYQFRLREILTPNILWLRTFAHLYNPYLLPKILHILKEKYGSVSLKIAGPIFNYDCFEQTMKLAEELGVKNMIEYCGAISKKEVPLFLQQGDIFLNTTNIDNHPVTVIEAMACGLCVVSTNVGGVPYLIEDGKNGLLVQKNNETEMADAICRLLNDCSLAKNISFNARKKAESFAWENIYSLWKKLFDEI